MGDEATFIPAVPRVPLATLPTPLERMTGIEQALRGVGAPSVPRLYLKRDDLLSTGLGGNKLRNLEFSLGAAVADGVTDVITMGRPQSNHCRLTAAACARIGLRAHLVFLGEPPARATGNLLLDGLLGAELHFTRSSERASRDALARELVGRIAAEGRHTCIVPVGGADARGALGHALAALEIVGQCEARGETVSAIVIATATGGTQAGLLAGLRKLGSQARVQAFAVSDANLRPIVLELANDVAQEIGVEDIGADAVLIDDSALGGGYGVPSDEGNAAIRLLARREGVLADPVYTGKALGGLLRRIGEGAFPSDECVVFVHTGGTPALFAA